ncbi:Hydrocephalus-inducing protein [Wickerhamomyces ciferrii]|uniref:Hydrocephalus-inducing protein n=1 Tax=Wickerhamomyces ciferrii (strain ATCC 14091 / BCRC 22168 / CBS 111 / JCM 3599 / NBRC 0793 / NRRL Y-1031 F-60-10) TaxID=1206466 RepID=K0L0I2_WICCF|nr:Hydrocephalus-inducing protein [Wickerhamomyces ciferrii]CCH47084.1 Hydrocephalus-inducing protein [Wickerhamomyces ciferrii]
MAKKNAGENSKKAAGNAKKAENANKKKAEELARAEADEEDKWAQGSKKGNKKKEDEAAKKAEAAKKKAEREALLKEEEASLPSKPANNKNRGANKVASRRAGKIDDFLNDQPVTSEISASGIDGVLEALTLTNKSGAVSDKDIDRHPERRFKAAYNAFEERRLPEARKENPGLRLQQVKQLLFKEFEKSPENPFNQNTNISHNATQEEVSALKDKIKKEREGKYTN